MKQQPTHPKPSFFPISGVQGTVLAICLPLALGTALAACTSGGASDPQQRGQPTVKVGITCPPVSPDKDTAASANSGEDSPETPGHASKDGETGAADGAVTLDGLPPLDPRVQERMAQYLNARSAYFADWDPTGQGMIVLTRFGDVDQVHRVERPLGARKQLTYLSEPVREASFFPQPGRSPKDSSVSPSILIYADQGGAENYQLHALNLSRGSLKRLTDGTSRTGSFLWSPKGKLAFTSTARNGRDFDIYLFKNPPQGEAQRVLEVQGHFVPLDFSPDETQLLLMEYISLNETYLHLLDLETGQATLLTPKDGKKVARLSAVWAKNGKAVYLTSDHDGDFVSLYRLDLTSKKYTPLSARIPWDVENLEMSPDRKTLAFTINQEGFSKVYLLSTATGKARPLPLPDGIIRGLRFTKAGPLRLGFSLIQPTNPTDAYSYDLRRKKLVRWTASEVGGLDTDRFVAPELVRFPTFDKVSDAPDAQQRTIPAFYFKPQGKGPHPVVVAIHGGPEAQYRPYFNAQLQYWVNELGLAVLAPNVRGSAGYGKSYLLLDNGFSREDSVKDIGALLDWITTRPELDARRVMVYGGSYGGYMVLASLVHFGDRLRGGVDWVGISNFVTFLKNTKGYRRDLRRAEYGDERDPKMHDFLQRISPLNHTDKFTTPVFVIQGANDPRVPATESEQLVQAVRQAGQKVWYLLAHNEGHGFRKKKNRDLAQVYTAQFIQTFLLGR